MKTITLSSIIAFMICGPVHAQFDMMPSHAGPINYLVPGNYPLTIYVKNLDINYPITFFDSFWQLNNGPVHSCAVQGTDLNFLDMLYPGYFADSFTHCDALEISEPGTYTFKTWTANPEGNPDANPANDTLYTTITVVNELPEKHVLFFMGSHQNCFPCGGMGETNMYYVLDNYPDDVFLVKAHDDFPSDPFSCDDCMDFNDAYIWPFTGHPAFLFDLYSFPFYDNPVTMFYDDQSQAMEWRLPYQSPLDVSFENVELDMENNMVTGDLRTTFYAAYEGSLAMNVILTEDSIYGPQAGYPLNDSLYHRFVMHDMAAGVWGDATVIPSSVEQGSEYVYSFTMPIPENADAGQLYVTGYVQKHAGNVLENEIFNSTQMRLQETLGNEVSDSSAGQNSFRAFPNPASNSVSIIYPGNSTKLVVINLLGQEVISIPIPERSQVLQLDCSMLNKGCYVLADEFGNRIIISILGTSKNL